MASRDEQVSALAKAYVDARRELELAEDTSRTAEAERDRAGKLVGSITNDLMAFVGDNISRRIVRCGEKAVVIQHKLGVSLEDLL